MSCPPPRLLARLRRWLGEPYYLDLQRVDVDLGLRLWRRSDGDLISDVHLNMSFDAPHELRGVQLVWVNASQPPALEVEYLHLAGGVSQALLREIGWTRVDAADASLPAFTMDVSLVDAADVWGARSVDLGLRFLASAEAPTGACMAAVRVARMSPWRRLTQRLQAARLRLNPWPVATAALIYQGMTDTDPLWRPLWWSIAAWSAVRALNPARLF